MKDQEDTLNEKNVSTDFIVVDLRQSIGTLMNRMELDRPGQIVVWDNDENHIYLQDGEIIRRLAKNWDRKISIKTLIDNNSYHFRAAGMAIAAIRNGRGNSPGAFYGPLDPDGSIPGLYDDTPGEDDNPEHNPLFDPEPIPDDMQETGAARDFVEGVPEGMTGVPPDGPPISPVLPLFIVSEFEERIEEGGQLPVEVYLSRIGGRHSGKPLKLKKGWEIEIVVIPKSGLDMEGDFFRSIVVDEKNLDRRIPFYMRAQHREGTARFVVTARYKGRQLLYEEYEVEVVSAIQSAPGRLTSTQPVVHEEPSGDVPDLTVLISTAGQGNTTLQYRLFSRDKALGLNYNKFEINLGRPDVGTFFLEFFNDIDNLKMTTEQDRKNAARKMQGKGAELYKSLFPKEMKETLWKIREEIKTVSIYSEEPWIPWEMCFMYSEQTGINDGAFLCELYEISRWISGCLPPGSSLSLDSAAAVIPSDSRLPFAEKEKEKLKATIESHKGTFTPVPASYEEVSQSFKEGAHTIWHFSGHGTDSQGTNTSGYNIILENKDRLSPSDIVGVKNIGRNKPLVFFNACQVGRPGMGLTGLSGWPPELLNNNVAAFIGAYWSVHDETAYKLAAKFYELLAAGQNIAGALKGARLHVKDAGNPTWLSYTLYADPNAKVDLNK